MTKNKDHFKTERLREPDKTKYGLYSLLKTEVRRSGNWKELIAGLREKEWKGKSDKVQVIVFIMNGYSFSGSKIDRQFCYSKIDISLKTPSIRKQKYMTIKRIADNTLVALTQMIAESRTEKKDVIMKVVVNLINKKL